MTAEELIKKHYPNYDLGYRYRDNTCITVSTIKNILADRDKEIRDKIENTIEAIKPKITNEISSDQYYEWTACITILTEILTFIKEK